MGSFGKTALVTGGTGFVGSHLARRLVAEDWAVHLVVRHRSQFEQLTGILDAITLHYHDHSTSSMVKIVNKVKPSVVFHLASLFLVRHDAESITPLIESNILFGTQLLEAMSINGVSSLINTGTSWQHFHNKSYSPVNLYAATKEAFESILQYYVEVTPMRAITLQLFDTYGPRDPRSKLFTLLRKAAQDGQPISMSPGEQAIDIVYIDDVVRAFILAAHRFLSKTVDTHERYAVSSGRRIKLKDLVELYCQTTGDRVSVRWGALPYRFREVMEPWDHGRSLPGWEPRITLEEGIRIMKHFNEGLSQ